MSLWSASISRSPGPKLGPTAVIQGELFFERCSGILASLASAEMDLAQSNAQPLGRLHVHLTEHPRRHRMNKTTRAANAKRWTTSPPDRMACS